jgi:hypothetical protein
MGRINASESDGEDEPAVSDAAASSEAQGREKLKKSARIMVQIFKISDLNIIIVKQPQIIHLSKSYSKFALFAGT